MSEKISPKGRRGLPERLRNFGRHLVYSEGTKTEPYYVEDIKKCIADKYKVRPNDIEIIQGGKRRSRSTVSLANFAVKDVEERLQNGESIDHVWVFYDKDSFPEEDYLEAFKIINDRNTSINDEGIPCDSNSISWHSLPSNQCFELLLLLYFNYETSALNRKGYAKRIDALVQKTDKTFSYAKNLCGIHSKLIAAGGSINKAIRFGKRLEKEHGLENPSSRAYLFLEYFKLYLESK